MPENAGTGGLAGVVRELFPKLLKTYRVDDSMLVLSRGEYKSLYAHIEPVPFIPAIRVILTSSYSRSRMHSSHPRISEIDLASSF